MLPMRWDPFRDMSRDLRTLHREMDELFRKTFGTSHDTLPATAVEAPITLNAWIKDQTFHVQAEIPGVERDNLDITVDGNVLSLRGERKDESSVREGEYLVRECHIGTFVRRLTLPEGVNIDKIHARFNNGVLEITMPLDKTVGGRKVMIEGPDTGKSKKEIH